MQEAFFHVPALDSVHQLVYQRKVADGQSREPVAKVAGAGGDWGAVDVAAEEADRRRVVVEGEASWEEGGVETEMLHSDSSHPP